MVKWMCGVNLQAVEEAQPGRCNPGGLVTVTPDTSRLCWLLCCRLTLVILLSVWTVQKEFEIATLADLLILYCSLILATQSLLLSSNL